MRNLTKLKFMLLIPLLATLFSACGQPNVIGIRVSGYKTNFYIGEEFSINQESLSVIITDEKGADQNIQVDNLISESATLLKNDDISIDFSLFDNTKEGEYKIIVTFIRGTDVACDYTVSVSSRTFADTDCSVDNYSGTYDGKAHSIKVNQTLDATITYGLENGVYDLTENPTFTNAGVYTVYFKMEKYGYTPSIESYGTVEIKKANLTITPNDRLIKYGEDLVLNPHTDLVYDGFVNNETKDSLTGTLKYSTDYEKGKDVGIYPLTLTGYDETNYAITYEVASLQVERVDNNLVITFENIDYGEVLEPQIENPSQQAIQYRHQLKDDFRWINGLPTKAGEYTIEAKTLESKNFNQKTIEISQVIINKRDLTITCNDVNIKYNQDFVDNGLTISGFVNNENESILQGDIEYKTDYQTGNDAGVYDITIQGYQELENYNIIYVNGNLNVEKADNPLTVTVENIVYGEEIKYSLENDTVGKPITVEYLVGENQDYQLSMPNSAGKYKVRVSQEETKNYNGYQQVFDMEIYQKEVTLVWGYTGFEYDGNEHLPTLTLQGLVNNDECEVIVTGAKTQANEDGYIAVAERLTNSNYCLPEDNTIKFTINKLVVNAPQKSDIGTKYYNGMIQRSDMQVQSDKYVIYQNKGGINVGQYPVIFKLTDSINYKWNNSTTENTTVNFEILKNNTNEITDYSVESFTYGENPSEPMYKAKFGEVIVDYKLKTQENYAYTEEKPTNAGVYTARFRVLDTTNYNYATVTCDYEIYKKSITYPKFPVFEGKVGQTLSEIELPTSDIGKWEWEEDYTFTVAEQLIKTIKFVPNDTNYYSESGIVVVINVTNDELLDFKENDIVLKSAEYYYNEYQEYSIEVENNAEATLSYSLDSNNGYTSQLPMFFEIGEYEIYVRATKEGYNDLYQKATLTIKDWAMEVKVSQVELFIKGEELDLSDIKINVTYVSGKKVVLPYTDFEITGYDKNLLGEQYLTFSIDDRTFTNVMRVYVYEPYINQIMITTQNKDGETVRLFSEKISEREHQITFDSIKNFNIEKINILTDEVGPDAIIAHQISADIVMQDNTIVSQNKGSVDAYIQFYTEGYLENYILTINYDNEAIKFSSGISQSVYNEQGMCYDMTVVNTDTFQDLTTSYGEITGVYALETTEFNDENNLLNTIGKMADLYYEDYSQVYVKVKTNNIYFVAKLNLKVVDLPVTKINVNEQKYQILNNGQKFTFETQDMTSFKVSFDNLGDYFVCYRDELNYLSWLTSEDFAELILDGKQSLSIDFYVCNTQNQNDTIQKITIELVLSE